MMRGCGDHQMPPNAVSSSSSCPPWGGGGVNTGRHGPQQQPAPT